MVPKGLRSSTVAVGLLGVASALLPWVQQEGEAMSGLDRGGWPLILMGTAYVVVGLIGVHTIPSRWILAGASMVGFLAVGLGFSNVLRLEGSDSPIGVGLILAGTISMASLGVIWTMRIR